MRAHTMADSDSAIAADIAKLKAWAADEGVVLPEDVASVLAQYRWVFENRLRPVAQASGCEVLYVALKRAQAFASLTGRELNSTVALEVVWGHDVIH